MKLVKTEVKQNFNGQILFINASEHADGNTSQLGHKLLAGQAFSQLDLVNYKLYQLGQKFEDDQFATVLAQIEQATTIILGTPVYWHMLSGYLKTLLERLSQAAAPDSLGGKEIGVFVQGADPSDTIGPTNRMIQRFASVAGMTYIEMRY
ncbi:NAD(P)H-dependent oxidoreductase [Loigolactobacillus binensis]|uniref:NAD(P)H-dependent oxidoreductase n=1 Tax=Loigolactobacillus binensis TaxID=2559922 RepID=A0ABW3EAY7_9LACO|nr:NAD(P)H-dependent oxidoreductase [Loigolactobacillus binensis]